MNRREKIFQAKLYLVLDRQVLGYDAIFETMKQAVAAGVDVVQIRDKNGSRRDIERFSRQALEWLRGRAVFIINDFPDLAVAVGADGVHLGQEDISVGEIRESVSEDFLIGASCQTVQQAVRAEKEGADYIGFGSVFKTLTKPERQPMDPRRLEEAVGSMKIPVFAIGGIHPGNLPELVRRNIKRIAVTRAIMQAGDVPAAVGELKKQLE